MEQEILKTGTTTIGFHYADGVILAADRRATAGSMIVDKRIKKAVIINERMALTTAGSVSELQFLMKLIKAEIRLKEVSTNRPMLVKEAANLLSQLVYSSIRRMSMLPSIVHFLFAGKDQKGIHLYDIYPDGSLTEIETFVASGSGSVFAMGVLETLWKEKMSEAEAKTLALKAINAALQRDSASGDGIIIVRITKDGAQEIEAKTLTASLL
ncbi:MAG: proteasome subunit beta [Candidatus Woesearchaeota archaeon]